MARTQACGWIFWDYLECYYGGLRLRQKYPTIPLKWRYREILKGLPSALDLWEVVDRPSFSSRIAKPIQPPASVRSPGSRCRAMGWRWDPSPVRWIER